MAQSHVSLKYRDWLLIALSGGTHSIPELEDAVGGRMGAVSIAKKLKTWKREGLVEKHQEPGKPKHGWRLTAKGQLAAEDAQLALRA